MNSPPLLGLVAAVWITKELVAIAYVTVNALALFVGFLLGYYPGPFMLMHDLPLAMVLASRIMGFLNFHRDVEIICRWTVGDLMRGQAWNQAWRIKNFMKQFFKFYVVWFRLCTRFNSLVTCGGLFSAESRYASITGILVDILVSVLLEIKHSPRVSGICGCLGLLILKLLGSPLCALPSYELLVLSYITLCSDESEAHAKTLEHGTLYLETIARFCILSLFGNNFNEYNNAVFLAACKHCNFKTLRVLEVANGGVLDLFEGNVLLKRSMAQEQEQNQEQNQEQDTNKITKPLFQDIPESQTSKYFPIRSLILMRISRRPWFKLVNCYNITWTSDSMHKSYMNYGIISMIFYDRPIYLIREICQRLVNRCLMFAALIKNNVLHPDLVKLIKDWL